MSVDVAVIGAQKCGLCSTRHWLKRHPDLDVFDWEWWGWCWEPEDRIFHDTIEPSDECFAVAAQGPPFSQAKQEGKTRVLVTPQISMFDTAVNARLLKAHNPDMKIVMLTRDPVERAYISWWQATRQTDRPKVYDARPFEEAIEQCLAWRPVQDLCQPLQDQYVTAGEYGRIEKDFRDAGFQVGVAALTDLAAGQASTVSGLSDFLGVDLRALDLFPHVHAEGPELPVPDSDPVRRLRAYYDREGWRDHA